MKIGSRNVDVEGVDLLMDTEPFIKNSRTYVPIRFVAEGMGLKVDWNNDTQEVTIYGRKKYFTTEEAAGRDWCMHWHCYSMASAREISGIIYKCDNGYYWDNILVGQADTKQVAFSMVGLKKGVALVHSHSSEPINFAGGVGVEDIKVADAYKRNMYVVNSKGELYRYNPTTKTEELIYNGLPCDARHLDITRAAERQRDYFESGYFPLDEYKDGFKADFYNKLHMKGLSYLKERAV